MQPTMRIVIFTVIAIIVISFVSKSEEQRLEWNVPRRFCGSMLSDVMREVCEGSYADPDANKGYRKSKRSDRFYDVLPPKRKGIYDECCEMPCTPYYMRHNYCSDTNEDPRPYIQMPKPGERSYVPKSTTPRARVSVLSGICI